MLNLVYQEKDLYFKKKKYKGGIFLKHLKIYINI